MLTHSTSDVLEKSRERIPLFPSQQSLPLPNGERFHPSCELSLLGQRSELGGVVAAGKAFAPFFPC